MPLKIRGSRSVPPVTSPNGLITSAQVAALIRVKPSSKRKIPFNPIYPQGAVGVKGASWPMGRDGCMAGQALGEKGRGGDWDDGAIRADARQGAMRRGRLCGPWR